MAARSTHHLAAMVPAAAVAPARQSVFRALLGVGYCLGGAAVAGWLLALPR